MLAIPHPHPPRTLKEGTGKGLVFTCWIYCDTSKSQPIVTLPGLCRYNAILYDELLSVTAS